jgi:excinuclease ABC subunit B
MAEELAKYLTKGHIRCRYIHSEVDTLERSEIKTLEEFRCFMGVNLLVKVRFEVSLVAILDVTKKVLRSHRSTYTKQLVVRD